MALHYVYVYENEVRSKSFRTVRVENKQALLRTRLAKCGCTALSRSSVSLTLLYMHVIFLDRFCALPVVVLYDFVEARNDSANKRDPTSAVVYIITNLAMTCEPAEPGCYWGQTTVIEYWRDCLFRLIILSRNTFIYNNLNNSKMRISCNL